MSETPAQRVERIKKEKDGLDVIKDIHRLAKSGDAVEPENIDRFKYYGLYTQKDSDSRLFMLRVKLENGSLNLAQIDTVAKISKEFAQNTLSLTTRQDVQFHYIQVKDLPEIFERLSKVGLTTQMAAGDCPRNTVSCPISGVSSDIIDTTKILNDVNSYFQGNREFSNLPRKFKIAISGCDCVNKEIQDISFRAFNDKNGEVAFDISVGGGLSKGKEIAKRLNKSCKESELLAVAKAMAEIFRDEGSRENRGRARVRHLVADSGVAKILELIESKIDFKLADSSFEPTVTEYNDRGHFGINSSSKDGFDFIGFSVPAGELSGDKFEAIKSILESNGATTIRITTSQDLIVLDSPSQNSQTIVNEFEKIGIFANPSNFLINLKACTGNAYCKFALSETKHQAIKTAKYLEEKFPNFKEKVSISFTGCPNSCGHPQIVDFGFIGAPAKDESGEKTDGFTLQLGGFLKGEVSYFAKDTKVKTTSEDAPKLIELLLNEYLNSSYNNLQEFLAEREF